VGGSTVHCAVNMNMYLTYEYVYGGYRVQIRLDISKGKSPLNISRLNYKN
jgi:hypothetical protein